MVSFETFLALPAYAAPQRVGDYIYFLTNAQGPLSLYRISGLDGTPEPLLPPTIALQDPRQLGGHAYRVFPELAQILLMMDHDGDENFEPMVIPISGGNPEPLFAGHDWGTRARCTAYDLDRGVTFLRVDDPTSALQKAYQVDLRRRTRTRLAESAWGAYPLASSTDNDMTVLCDTFVFGDDVYYLWTANRGLDLLCGAPWESLTPYEKRTRTALGDCQFTFDDRCLLFVTTLFDDAFGLAWLDMRKPGTVQQLPADGLAHRGRGELNGLMRIRDARYCLSYNVDGCSWVYEALFDEAASLKMEVTSIICGDGALANGVCTRPDYDPRSDTYTLSFSTATSPSRLVSVRPDGHVIGCQQQREFDGGAEDYLAAGEDASFRSFDGVYVPARLYLPAAGLGFSGVRPVVYYIHGGPQAQERPELARASMLLVQFLTINGFAVFVPNVRGSTGYGLAYTRCVDRDWGGNDRLDHVHAMREVLRHDSRVAVSRVGVVGHSYGGYMALLLAARHPELWSAAADLFGAYDLVKFINASPASSRPYLSIAVGDPLRDRVSLEERSPSTYLDQIDCPVLVVQGRNDARVAERESRELVRQLHLLGKNVTYLLFDNEGHSFMNYDSRARCYMAVGDFFRRHLCS